MKRHPDDKIRIRAVAAEAELAEARLLIADLNEQLTRANAAASRMGRAAYRAGAVARASKAA